MSSVAVNPAVQRMRRLRTENCGLERMPDHQFVPMNIPSDELNVKI